MQQLSQYKKKVKYQKSRLERILTLHMTILEALYRYFHGGTNYDRQQPQLQPLLLLISTKEQRQRLFHPYLSFSFVPIQLSGSLPETFPKSLRVLYFLQSGNTSVASQERKNTQVIEFPAKILCGLSVAFQDRYNFLKTKEK